jgi:signal transduction histidine kinase
LQYDIQFDIQDSNIPVNPELRRNLYLVLKECLNNVIKHACATKVDIFFSCTENQFEMLVKDNGKGIKETAEVSFGNGLQNMRKRSGDSHCTIDFDSSSEGGTTIKITGKVY